MMIMPQYWDVLAHCIIAHHSVGSAQHGAASLHYDSDSGLLINFMRGIAASCHVNQVAGKLQAACACVI